MRISDVVSKVARHGFIGSSQIAIRLISATLSVPSDFFTRLTRLKTNSFQAVFVHEGGTLLKLPAASVMDLFSSEGRLRVMKSAQFTERPKKEVLLRRVVHAMYENGMLSRERCIVDIGAWLSDNAIVWSTFLRGDACVYAIDPAPRNIAFGKSIAVLNGRSNIRWVQEVCSDAKGIALHYQGKIDHARFNSNGVGKNSGLTTSTLDDVVGSDVDNIGLLHVDVEGFELNVLMGALDIIDQSRPLVLFEQHISKENVLAICHLLQSKGYVTYMINEVLPGCSLDCRNFLAAPVGLDVEKVLSVNPQNGRAEDTWYATLGGALIRLN